MPEIRDWLAELPPQLRGPLERAAAGLPKNVALMQILMECAEPQQAEKALRTGIGRLEQQRDVAGAGRLQAVVDLLRASPDAFGTVRSVLGSLDHARSAGGDEIAYWAAAFDRAASQNPEASVALYSLGDPALLDAATLEIVDRLARWGLLLPATECLDLGCGIGRFELALTERVSRIVGVDIAPAMVENARRRTSHLHNVEIRAASGRDLAGFRDQNFDLVLAVDAFPYIVQSGIALAERMISEAARVLRPHGALVVLNFSYRGDLYADQADVERLAGASGLQVRRSGTSDFSLWDAVTFELRKL
jgi:SAM-dependent methyltransferase